MVWHGGLESNRRRYDESGWPFAEGPLPSGVDFLLDERGTKDLLNVQTIVWLTEKPKKPLIVVSI